MWLDSRIEARTRLQLDGTKPPIFSPRSGSLSLSRGCMASRGLSLCRTISATASSGPGTKTRHLPICLLIARCVLIQASAILIRIYHHLSHIACRCLFPRLDSLVPPICLSAYQLSTICQYLRLSAELPHANRLTFAFTAVPSQPPLQRGPMAFMAYSRPDMQHRLDANPRLSAPDREYCPGALSPVSCSHPDAIQHRHSHPLSVYIREHAPHSPCYVCCPTTRSFSLPRLSCIVHALHHNGEERPRRTHSTSFVRHRKRRLGEPGACSSRCVIRFCFQWHGRLVGVGNHRRRGLRSCYHGNSPLPHSL